MRYSKVLLVLTLSFMLIFGGSIAAFAEDPFVPDTMTPLESPDSHSKPTISTSVDSSGHGLADGGVITSGSWPLYTYTGWISASVDPNYPDYYFLRWEKMNIFTGTYSFYSSSPSINNIGFSYSNDYPFNWHRYYKAFFAEKPDLTIWVNDSNMGGYSTTTDTGKYLPETQIDILPILAQDHRLDYWEYNGEWRSPSELISFAMPSCDVEIKLYFEPIPSFLITTAVEDEDDWGTVTGGGTYMVGSPVTLTATPARGYAFDYWEYQWDCQIVTGSEVQHTPMVIQDIYNNVMSFSMPECNGHYIAHFKPLDMYGVKLVVGKVVDNMKLPADEGEGGMPSLEENALPGDEDFDGYYYETERYNVDPNEFNHWSFVGYDWERMDEILPPPPMPTSMITTDEPEMPYLEFDSTDPEHLFKVFSFDKKITVYYEEDPYVLADVYFHDTDGVDLKAPLLDNKVYIGEAYEFVAPEIEGYELLYSSPNAEGVVPEEGENFMVIHVYDEIPETTEPPTQPPTQPQTEPETQLPTDAVIIPTTQPATEAPTEPATEALTEEETPLAPATTAAATEAAQEEIDVEEVPLADALPQTGQLPSELFYAIGTAISGLGLFLKRRK